MIARLRFELDGGAIAWAELSDDLLWSCDDPRPGMGALIARSLQALFDPREDLSPSRGRPGFAAIHAAAEWLGATIDYLSEPEDDRDAIY